MIERVRRIIHRRSSGPEPVTPYRSFGSWDALNTDERRTIQICHPEWRGVRTAAYAFGDPVIESAVLGTDLADEIAGAGVNTVVVHAAPPGTATFMKHASSRGVTMMQVIHSSMAQHGSDAGEAEAVSTALQLLSSRDLHRIGFVKMGVAEVFQGLGYSALHVPNRVPSLPRIEKVALPAGLNVGVFHDPYWRKNVTTQLGATSLLDGTAHVIRRPDVDYLDHIPIVEHGTLPWEDFVSLQASVDINLYVTLSECHPMGPMESYLADVPCLVSRTSELFRDDEDLRDLTTVTDLDDPTAIAEATQRLLADAPVAIDRARSWMARHDTTAEHAWRSFTTP